MNKKHITTMAEASSSSSSSSFSSPAPSAAAAALSAKNEKGNIGYSARLVLDIARAEGFGALLAGVVPRVVKVAPSCAIMISTYEMGKSFFLKRRAALAAEERER